MMSSFSEVTLQKMLSELNHTEQSVQTVSLWLIHHRKRAVAVCHAWYKFVKSQRQPRKLINLLYLCNDVLQNSRRKGPEYHHQFCEVLEKALMHISHYAVDEKSLKSIRRILDIWKQRQVFDKKFIDKLVYVVSSNLSKHNLQYFIPKNNVSVKVSSLSATKEQTSRSDANSTFPSTSSKKVNNTPSTSNQVEQNTLSMSTTPPPNFSEELFPKQLSPQDSPIEVPVTETIMQAVRKLNKAASADGFTRKQIAAFPPEVADIGRLDAVQTRYQAEQLGVVVDNAHSILSEYNARLSQEVSGRTMMQKQLRSYLHHQKNMIMQDEQLLEQWVSKLQQMDRDRATLSAHVDSLPDLSQTPKNLAPLPEAGELFSGF